MEVVIPYGTAVFVPGAGHNWHVRHPSGGWSVVEGSVVRFLGGAECDQLESAYQEAATKVPIAQSLPSYMIE